MYLYRSFSSPLGFLTVCEDSTGIFMIWFGTPDDAFFASVKKLTHLENGSVGGLITKELITQLNAYFLGQLTQFDVPLSFYGTAFQKAVWKGIYAVPFGQLTHYGDLAILAGSPKASRAVGGATGKNPIPIVVPCHRIVGKNGALTGFSAPGGLVTKIKLLELEGIHYEL